MSNLAILADIENDFTSSSKNQIKQLNFEYNNVDDDKYLAAYAEKYRNDELLVDDVELDEAEMEAYKNLMEAHRRIERMENDDEDSVPVSQMFLRDTKAVYDVDAVKACMNKLPIQSKNLDWIFTLQLTSSTPLKIANHEDDIDREIQFYTQAVTSAKEGFKQIHTLGIPVHRPDDYFAEMVKSDDHMAKIRNKLVQSKKVIEDREKRRQRKEHQKIGKQLKAERLKEKISKKKTDIEAIDHWRRTQSGTGKEFDIDKATEDYKQVQGMSDKRDKFTKGGAQHKKNNAIKKRPGKRTRSK